MRDNAERLACILAEGIQDLPTPAELETPFGIDAEWIRYATAAELQELSKLHNRIIRKQQALTLLIQVRAQIRRTCTQRARRANGKN